MFRFTLTIFHPHIQILGCHGKIWGWSPTPLICKKTMTTDQQPIKTNIYFSHFSDNFFHIFPYPNPKFCASWEEMGMNQRCFPFFHFSHPNIYIAGILGKNGIGPLHFIHIISISKSKFRHVLGKNGLEAQPAKYSFVFCVSLVCLGTAYANGV